MTKIMRLEITVTECARASAWVALRSGTGIIDYLEIAS